jgi:hypothetical protein
VVVVEETTITHVQRVIRYKMSSQNIRTKDCGYGCGKKIYWDVEKNMYLELMTKQKHICPNRQNKATNTTNVSTGQVGGGTNTQPYVKKQYSYSPSQQQQQQEKPKMANSFEHLTGSPRAIRKMYEKLSELIRDAGGKVHGSQRGLDDEKKLDILVYYEVPELTMLGVQKKFNDYAIGDLE